MEKFDSFTSPEDSETSSSGGSLLKPGFVEYITTISSNEKSQMMNLVQYGGLAILPLLVLLKLMKMYIPPEDPNKGSTELIIEVVLQLSFMLLALFMIHKLIIFVPPYSSLAYGNINIITMILPLFFLMLALDTNVSEKLNTLFDRLLLVVGLKKEAFEDNEQHIKPVGLQTQSSQQVVQQIGANTTLPPSQTQEVFQVPKQQEHAAHYDSLTYSQEPMAVGGGSSFGSIY
jgi:hypothetical protein